MPKITDEEKGRMNASNPPNQQVNLGDVLQSLGDGTGFTLPTSDPGVAGDLWSNSGVVTVSAG